MVQGGIPHEVTIVWRSRFARRQTIITSSSRRLPPCVRAPQANESGDERDQEDLAGKHLEHGQDLADVAGRYEVAVAGRGQRRIAEEQVVATLRVSDAGEDIAVPQPSEREEQKTEQQAEEGVDADRSEDR